MLRERYLKEIQTQLRVQPICAILGPRQVGKTTLARQYIAQHFPDNALLFDLEDQADLDRLKNPMLALTNIAEKIVVIDEVQLLPHLFKALRVIVDLPETKHKFLILGSASRDLLRQSSETLAGRIGYIELPPFSLFETHESRLLQIRGGFPRSFLAASDKDSYIWRQNYITTFLERDIPNLGFTIPSAHLRRFWMMLTAYHGQILNLSALARSLMISDNTVKKYVEILQGTFMIRVLQPWFENMSKRQVKSPKIYFRDVGILNALLGITQWNDLRINPNLGAIWEGYALEEIIRFIDAKPEEVYFWSTHASAELDLLVMKDGKRLGFEYKYADSPKVTRSMHSALHDLRLDHLFIIYPGKKKYLLDEKITLCGLENYVF